ncbi:MAG: hypothetical protein JSS71_02135 [Armatimonadetes bacterium]|nr:hypothetical protein [Armatimonadota bacterium]MBX3108178.1 hypothetical protein [Fimbriimonadaceae bacterium]
MITPKKSVLVMVYAVAIVPLVAVVGGSVWLYSDLYATGERFGQAVENGSSDLVPTEPQAFERSDPPEPGQDAAVLFEKAAAEWEQFPEEERTRLVAESRLYALPGDKPDGRFGESFAKCRPFVQSLGQAASLSDSRFQRQWSGDTELLEPHYHTTIQFGRLMTAFALADARDGRFDQAFNRLGQLRRIGWHISRDSGLDGLVTHVNLETQALAAAVEIAFNYGDRPGTIDRYRAFLAERGTRPDLFRNMQGEAMRTIHVLSRPDSFNDRMFSGSRLSINNPMFQRAAAVRMAEFWSSALESSQEDGNDPFASADSYRSAVRDFARLKSPSRIVPLAIADWNLARVGLAASLEARYLLASALAGALEGSHGTASLPESLGTIRELDPYTGEALAYSKTAEGCAIWCAGSDRRMGSGSGDPADVSLSIAGGTASFEGQ